jgi:hypothetical protein
MVPVSITGGSKGCSLYEIGATTWSKLKKSGGNKLVWSNFGTSKIYYLVLSIVILKPMSK